MDTSLHSMSNLLAQLGLASDEQGLEAFFSKNQLAEGQTLSQAAFFNQAQQQFIKEALAEDSDWAEIVDRMDARLRH